MGSLDLRLDLPARYRPLHHLANGGMASVWVAHDELLDRDVAVKVLAPQLAADDDARVRFTREARAAARLSAHPNVVTVYDAGEHAGQAFLVMALYAGGTVAERLRERLPDPELALRWLGEAAEGLDAAHAMGVVHRDVKPGNLLLDDRDRVAVGDFGIATAAWAASVTRTGLVVGTMAYLAPEQRSGGAATAASDRYALGIVAHELLTGARPADGRLEVALPAPTRAVLERATALDPADRPPSCRAFVAELARTLADPAGRTAILAAAPHDGRDGPSAAAAAGAAAGAAGAGAAADTGATAAATPVAGPNGGEEATAVQRVPRSPAPPLPPDDTGVGPRSAAGPPARGRTPLLLAAVAAVALAGGAGAALLGGDEDPAAGAGATTAARTASERPRTTATARATPAPTPAPAAETPAPAPSDDPRALNDAGFALMNDGRYAEALPLLERAVSGLAATPDDINYAYALYNLGATLRRLGRPEEAIPHLERRLEVSDFKREIVQAELDGARQDAGLVPAKPGKPGKGKKDKGDDEDD